MAHLHIPRWRKCITKDCANSIWPHLSIQPHPTSDFSRESGNAGRSLRYVNQTRDLKSSLKSSKLDGTELSPFFLALFSKKNSCKKQFQNKGRMYDTVHAFLQSNIKYACLQRFLEICCNPFCIHCGKFNHEPIQCHITSWTHSKLHSRFYFVELFIGSTPWSNAVLTF